MRRTSFEQFIVENGIISISDQYEARDKIKDLKTDGGEAVNFGKMLVKMGKLTERQYADIYARWLNVGFFDVAAVAFDEDMVRSIPESVERKYCCIPACKDYDGKTIFVTDEPLDYAAIDALKTITGGPVEMLMGCASDIKEALDKVYVPLNLKAPFDDEAEYSFTIEKAAKLFNIGVCRPSEVTPDKRLLKMIPYETAVKYCCLPLSAGEDGCTIATDNPADLDAYEELKKLLGCPVRFRIAKRRELLLKIAEVYEVSLI